MTALTLIFTPCLSRLSVKSAAAHRSMLTVFKAIEDNTESFGRKSETIKNNIADEKKNQIEIIKMKIAMTKEVKSSGWI